MSSYRILGGCSLSDHLPVTLTLSFEEVRDQRSAWKMNIRYLKETKVEVWRIWASQPAGSSFFGKLRRVLHFYRDFSKQKAEKLRAAEAQLKQDLKETLIRLHEDPCSYSLQLRAATARESLAELESNKIEGQRIRSRIKWRDKGDACNREFFQIVGEKPRTHVISKLKDENGALTSDSREMLEIGQRFYEKLYSAPPAADQGAFEKVLNMIAPKVTEDMRTSLDQPFSFEELRDAAKDLATDKAPRPDGISIAFYMHHWDLIGGDFLNMINQALREGALPATMIQGAITLLYKSGEKEDLSNWRSITLLNTSYKILAKALQLRLKPFLAEIISSDQTAFVPKGTFWIMFL